METEKDNEKVSFFKRIDNKIMAWQERQKEFNKTVLLAYMLVFWFLILIVLFFASIEIYRTENSWTGGIILLTCWIGMIFPMILTITHLDKKSKNNK